MSLFSRKLVWRVVLAGFILTSVLYFSDPLNRFMLGKAYIAATSPLSMINGKRFVVEAPASTPIEDVLRKYLTGILEPGDKVIEVKPADFISRHTGLWFSDNIWGARIQRRGRDRFIILWPFPSTSYWTIKE